MRCDEWYRFPHLDLSVVMDMVPCLAKHMTSPDMWKDCIAEVIMLLLRHVAVLGKNALDAFPVTIHVYGGAKMFHEKAIAAILQHLAIVDGYDLVKSYRTLQEGWPKSIYCLMSQKICYSGRG